LFKHISSDPDNDSLTYSWKLDNEEQTTTQNWTYLPDTTQCGDHKVKLIVSDGTDSDSKEWNVTVYLQGDVDLNDRVDIFDLATVGLCYGEPVAGECKKADIFPEPGKNGEEEGDGNINIFDLAMIGLNYGRSC